MEKFGKDYKEAVSRIRFEPITAETIKKRHERRICAVKARGRAAVGVASAIICLTVACSLVVQYKEGGAITAYAYETDNLILRGGSKILDVATKTSSVSYATVDRTGPTLTTTTVQFMVVDKDGYQKSSSEYIHGIGRAYLSYEGYDTKKGDVVRLKAINPAGINSGASIEVVGAWAP